jgi:hypothetical protein
VLPAEVDIGQSGGVPIPAHLMNSVDAVHEQVLLEQYSLRKKSIADEVAQIQADILNLAANSMINQGMENQKSASNSSLPAQKTTLAREELAEFDSAKSPDDPWDTAAKKTPPVDDWTELHHVMGIPTTTKSKSPIESSQPSVSNPAIPPPIPKRPSKMTIQSDSPTTIPNQMPVPTPIAQPNPSSKRRPPAVPSPSQYPVGLHTSPPVPPVPPKLNASSLADIALEHRVRPAHFFV